MNIAHIAPNVGRELSLRTVNSLWRAGQLIIDATGDKSSRRSGIRQLVEWPGIKGRTSLLQQACRLASYWTEEEATTCRLSIRNAIALLALDGLAERYHKAKDPQTASQILSERQRLLHREQQVTAKEIREVKIRFLPESAARLSDSRRFVLAQLTKARDRVAADEPFAGEKREVFHGLVLQLDRLKGEVEAHYPAAKTKKSRDPAGNSLRLIKPKS